MSVHLLASSSSSSNICTASAPFLPSEPTRSPGCCMLPPHPSHLCHGTSSSAPRPGPVHGTGYKKSWRDSGAVAIASRIVQANDY